MDKLVTTCKAGKEGMGVSIPLHIKYTLSQYVHFSCDNPRTYTKVCACKHYPEHYAHKEHVHVHK